MIILMKSNKTLVITKTSKLYQKESVAEHLVFYVPTTYSSGASGGDYDLTEFTATLQYVDAANNAHSELLTAEEQSDKDGYIKYILPVSSELTYVAGDVTLQLSLSKVDTETSTNYVLHTSELTITILTWNDYFASVSDDSLSAIDAKILELQTQIEALKSLADIYSVAVPSDLQLTDSLLQLKNESGTIGDGVNVLVSDPDEDNSDDAVIDLSIVSI